MLSKVGLARRDPARTRDLRSRSLGAAFLSLLWCIWRAGPALAGPTFSSAPPMVDFHDQQAGTVSPAQAVAITNTGSGFLVVSLDCTLQGPNADEFEVIENPDPQVACLRCGVGLLLEPKAQCQVGVRFHPKSGGAKSAFLQVVSNDPDSSNPANGARRIPLLGNGVEPRPAARLNTDLLEFGYQRLNVLSHPQVVRIANTGLADLLIRSVTISGDQASDYSIQQGGVASSVRPNESSNIGITFAPSAEGVRSARLTIVDNAPGTPHVVALNGIGIPSSGSGYELVGDTVQLADAQFRLTSADPHATGSVWETAKQRVATGFQTTFTFRVSQPGGAPDPTGAVGGDGFAFVIQNSSASALGGGDSGLGYAGIPNSLAIEFDMWLNDSSFFKVPDPDGHHISVHTAGTAANSADEFYSIAHATSPDFKDGAPHLVNIAYRTGILQVTVDGVRILPPVTVDLGQLLRLDAGQAWVGFTAATSAAFEEHEILNWGFSPLSNP